ncbi:MAG: SDR family oxidoreductase [Desulfurococcaceae archaeon]
MVVLITGVSSSPGFKTAVAISSRGKNVLGVYNRNPITLENAAILRADLAKDAGKIVNEFKPSTVIHTAALGNVDLCEEDRAFCHRVNVEATRILMREAYKIGAKQIYLSTDYVFDGGKGLYKEEELPNPANYYGLTKLLGEEVTLALGGLVVRTSAIYGVGPGRANFGKIIVDKLFLGEKIKAFVDQWLSPTLNTILGEALAKLAIDFNVEGIVHVAGPRLSRYELVSAIARTFGFRDDLIEQASVRDVAFRAPRPRDSSLNNEKASELLKINLNDLNYALNAFRNEYLQYSSLSPLN